MRALANLPRFLGSTQRSLKILGWCEDFIRPSDLVLDVGSGKGHVAFQINQVLGAKVICIDIADRHRFGIPFVRCDARALPFPDKSFDVTLLSFVLHHLPECGRLLSEVKRTSRKRIIVFEDTFRNQWEWFVAQSFDSLWNGLDWRQVYSHFLRVEDWRRLFDEVGLVVVDEKCLDRSGPQDFDPVRHVRFVLSC